MDQETTLDSILSDEPADVVDTAPEAVTEDGPARDDHGRFAAKTGVEPLADGQGDTVPPTDQLPKEEYKAIREEREKRQTLERELEALKQQVQSFQNPPAPPPSVFEDEEGAFSHFGSQVVSSAVQQATFNAKLDMSEMMVRQANPDFEEVKATFLALANQNPDLRQQALADPHPWNKAYQIAKNHQAMQELGAVNVSDLEAKIREKVLAELQQGQSAAPQSVIPPSLTGERSVGARTGPQWSGPKPLSELLR